MATEEPAAASPSSTPATTPTTWPGTVAPTPPVVDHGVVEGQLDDLLLQESVVSQILGVIEDAARAVAQGQPRWVDPDVFGGTGKGERMARHTVRAQARVYEALDQAMEALAQHHGSLSVFREEVRRVESDGADQLAALRARLGEVAP